MKSLVRGSIRPEATEPMSIRFLFFFIGAASIAAAQPAAAAAQVTIIRFEDATDDDGQLDILIFHGGLIHLISQEHTLFRGLGNGEFADVFRQAGPVLSERTVARGACFADYDNDGKVDAYLVNLGAQGTLLHNVSTDTGHWISIKLEGTKSNRDGIGARIEVLAAGKRWTAERVASTGYLSQDDGRTHFGLGAATTIDKLIVRWPSGREQTLENIAVDRVLTVEEPK